MKDKGNSDHPHTHNQTKGAILDFKQLGQRTFSVHRVASAPAPPNLPESLRMTFSLFLQPIEVKITVGCEGAE